MTIEAWVKPTTVGGFRTVIVKERPGDLVYGLYAAPTRAGRSRRSTVGGARLRDGTAGVPAARGRTSPSTFDGTTQRLFVNGTQVGTLAVAGAILDLDLALKIGGNSIWGEWFTGLIDEVRIYNRALTRGRDPGRHERRRSRRPTRRRRARPGRSPRPAR